MKAKILSLFLICVLMFSFAACGAPAENPTDSAASNAVLGTSTETSSDVSSDLSSDTDVSDSAVSSETSENATGTDEFTDEFTDELTEDTITEGTSDEEYSDEEYSEGPDEGFDEDFVEEEFVPDTSGRKFLATDITQHRIVVYDLDACKGDYSKLTDDWVSVVWEWDAEDDPNRTAYNPGYGLDSAKLRYSPYYKKYVVVACSSNGWVGVIDYEYSTVLWNTRLVSGPHSVEMLPNGDLVVAISSSGNNISYIPLSAGITEVVSTIPSPGAHGICWDPQKQCLWALENDSVYQVKVENMGTKNAKLVRVEGKGIKIKNGGGHVLTPVYGSPGKYYVAAGSKIYLFDTDAMTLTENFPRAGSIQSKKDTKGICAFADGTVVICGVKITNGTSTYNWSCDAFRIIEKGAAADGSQDKITDVTFNVKDREFYKIQPLTLNYQ